jgi:dihydrofolate reductase
MKATVFIATSLDGFIAREDGGIDWLNSPDGAAPGEDYGYRALFDSVDAVVMGRNTYELVQSFGLKEWPYGTKPVVVLTNRPLEIPESIAATVETMSGSPDAVVERLAARGLKHLYVDGGSTIQNFLAEGQIQRLILSRIPVLIGRGIPLFGPVPHDIRLRHVETRSFSSGLVQSEYEVATNEPAGSDDDP